MGFCLHICLWNPRVWTFNSMKAIEQYFHVRLLITPCNAVLHFEYIYMDENLLCDHPNESYWAVFSSGSVYYADQCGPSFWVYSLKLNLWPFKWNLLSILYKVLPPFKPVNRDLEQTKASFWSTQIKAIEQLFHELFYITVQVLVKNGNSEKYLIGTANKERNRYGCFNRTWTKFLSHVCEWVPKTTT